LSLGEKIRRFVIFLISDLGADSKFLSFEMRVCQSLAMELSVYWEESEKLPISWEDFDSVKFAKNGKLKHQLSRVKAYNSLALLPSFPTIIDKPGVSREHIGCKLYLISRNEEIARTGVKGRYAVLIKTEALDSSPIMFFSAFITEKEAQTILRDIQNFDPDNQPLAFDDLTPFELEDKEFRKNNFRGFDNLSILQSRESGAAPLVTFWNMSAFALLLLLIWYFWIKRRHR
jgi:hypothetical protein